MSHATDGGGAFGAGCGERPCQGLRAHSFRTRVSRSLQPAPKLEAISTWSASSGRWCTLSQEDSADRAAGCRATRSAKARGSSPATARAADASRRSSERCCDLRKSSRAVVVSETGGTFSGT
jgi:hypothetical protein